MSINKRNYYPKHHPVYHGGLIGRLGVLDWEYCLPSETFEYELTGYLRMGQLRQFITVDPFVHIASYWCPMRYAYENDTNTWEDVIEAGQQYDPVANPLDEITSSSAGGAADFQWLPKHPDLGTVPAFLIRMYNMIWNWYYRIKNYDTSPISLDTHANGVSTYQWFGRCDRDWETSEIGEVS